MRHKCTAVLIGAILATAAIDIPGVEADHPTHQHMYSGTTTSASDASDTMRFDLVCAPIDVGGACTGELQFSNQRASQAVRGSLHRKDRGVVLTVLAIDRSIDCRLTEVVPKGKSLGPLGQDFSFNVRCTPSNNYIASTDVVHRIQMRARAFRLP